MRDSSRRCSIWKGAVNSRDIDRYADIVAEDAVWIPPHREAIVWRQAFRCTVETLEQGCCRGQGRGHALQARVRGE